MACKGVLQSDINKLNVTASAVAFNGPYEANELTVKFISVQFISFALHVRALTCETNTNQTWV